MKLTTAIALLLLVFPWFGNGPESTSHPEGQRPDVWAPLSFDELVTLSSLSTPPEELSVRLNQLLTTPVVHNLAADAVPPHRPVVKNLGPVIRVSVWNIERAVNFEPAQRRFRVAHDGIFLNLEREPQRQLSDASIHGRATGDAERG